MMTQWRGVGPVLVGVLLWLAGAGAAWGQTEFFGVKLDGSVEVGVRAYLDRPSEDEDAKYEEYRDIPAGLFLEDLNLRLSTKDDRYFFEFRAREAGEEDQSFKLRSSKLGLYDFEFEWDQTPHIFSTTGRMLGVETQQGVFTLPTPRPSLSTYNTAPELDDIGVRWDTARILLSLTPSPEWDLRAEYIRINKDGERPMGMAFGSPGNNFIEILEPIEQTIHDFKVSASLARERYQLQFTYNLSVFQNALEAVMADNPCSGLSQCGSSNAAGPPTGQTALAPDNLAHTWTLSGGANLPLRTRVSGSLSYSWRLQDQQFLPYTVNPAIISAHANELVLPQSDLNGDVRVLLLNLSATSRPLRPLTLTARYRLFDFNDQSDEILFPVHVLNDRTFEDEPRLANRFPYTKHNASLDSRWHILGPLAFTVGAGWERWDRSEQHREAPLTDEYIPKAVLDYTPADWILLRATYAPSWRRISGYNTFAHLAHTITEEEFPEAAATSQDPLLRKFDEADRDRHRADLLLELTPFNTLTASLSYSLRDDKYGESVYGLQDDESWAAGIDITWTPMERFSLFASYMREEFFARQASKYREPGQLGNPTYEWMARTYDTIDTVAAGVKAVLVPKILDFGANWNFSYALSRMTAFNPVTPTGGTTTQNTAAIAFNYPAMEDTIHRVEAFLRYHFWKKWTAKLQYVFESFDQTDFRTDNLVQSNPGSFDIFLGSDVKDYTAHTLALLVGYRF